MKFKPEKDFKRPWGGYIKFIDNKPCTVKIHFFKKGETWSLQNHKLREEFWYVISGKVRTYIGKKQKQLKREILKEGKCTFAPKKYFHRMEAIEPSKVLEITIGKFKENDEVRYWDKYGRKSPK